MGRVAGALGYGTGRQDGSAMLKKRIPTPKSGPKGRAYDLAHRAWRAGVIDAWWLMEDGSWSLVVRGARVDGLDVEGFTALVVVNLHSAGVDSVEWGETWCGFRQVLVSVMGEQVAA